MTALSEQAVPEQADAFGVSALRDATLAAWRASPTRLIEDARAEADLAAVGYRDRLCTELAANAADAAAAAGIVGRLSVWVDNGALHVANSGQPLTVEGVASLLALRVSAKDDDPATVGRFGVGFAAVVPVADRVEVRSTTTTLVFDRAQTEAALADSGTAPTGIALPDGVSAPLLRLAWVGDATPADGVDTEIVVTPRAWIAVADLMADFAVEACDRLLELPALGEIIVDGVSVTRVRSGDTIRFAPASSLPGAARVWREAVTGEVRWLHAGGADGDLLSDGEVLRTPTPTDIAISVPARVIAALPVTPDRRHLMPGVDVAVLAPGYLALVQALAPAQRPALVPRGLARNPTDARLCEAVIDVLRDGAWVPPAHGEADLPPARTLIVADLSDELADCLGPVLASLAHPEVSGPAQRSALLAVGAREIGLAEIAEALADVERPAHWWAQLYEALAPLVATGREAEELGALPVPRVDDRRHFGARGLLIAPAGVGAAWAPMVHPDAVHPLLERLGAESVGAGALLAHEGLVAALADAAEHGDDAEVGGLADAVLSLLAADEDAVLPAAASAELLLPDADGELVHVDELLPADAPLAEVLGDDLPFALLDAAVQARHGSSALRRAGVGWGFLTVAAQWPTAPDHDLDDEDRWWSSLSEPPSEMVAVRDLDLVPDDRWADALALLAADPATAPLLADRDGYTAWWLREHAVIDGRRLGIYRHPDATAFAGIVDPLPHPEAAALSGVLIGDALTDTDSAALVLANLGDSDRTIEPGVGVRAYGEVVAAVARGDVDVDDLAEALDAPPSARALDGSVIGNGDIGAEPIDAVVIDAPHFLSVIPASGAVVAGLPITVDAARELAGLLDLPLASEAVRVRVVSAGRATTWSADIDAMRFAADRELTDLHGEVVVHDGLVVDVDGAEHPVPWWRDEAGHLHIDVS